MKNDGYINITYPDGRQERVPSGTRAFELAAAISPEFERQVIAVKVNGQLRDISIPLTEDARIEFLRPSDPEGHEVLLHSTSHIMAQAVKRLFPNAKVTIGPAIENGFYYDFDVDRPFTEEDLPRIEEEMRRIIKEDLPIERVELRRDEALKEFSERDEPYKVEIIQEIPDGEVISAYRQGEFIDLCRGPHLKSTGRAGAFKLLSVAGAYWRGDESQKMLSRIYGTAWGSKKELKRYLKLLEEAKARDHRQLGKELDWFSFHPEAPANVFFHEKGALIYNLILAYMRRSNDKYGYREVHTPLILSDSLWRQSGHYEHYRENMYFTRVENRDYAVKPMNCPGHTLIYRNSERSYRDLPLRMSEFGRVHRYEKSGVTHGLFRVRSFVQDDAHIFCTEDQIHGEVEKILAQLREVYRDFGFDEVHVELSTRPEESIGSDEVWEKAEKALEEVLKAEQMDYQLNPGEGAFYGPKIDFHIEDSLRRRWQCGTIQLDFSMPLRFGLTYTGEDGKDHTPVMIHRAILGSIERFMGILIEHYAGNLPLWLAPVQLKILPIADRHLPYARQMENFFREAGFRCETNSRNEKVGRKIRLAEMEKVPYMLVLGDREQQSGEVRLRKHGEGDLGALQPQAVVELLQKELKEKVYR